MNGIRENPGPEYEKYYYRQYLRGQRQIHILENKVKDLLEENFNLRNGGESENGIKNCKCRKGKGK